MIPRVEFDPTAPAPLDGIRVVDISRLVAGNMVSLQMADQGAEVIRAWGIAIARRRGAKRARVAVARKLAVIMHRMWVSGSVFEIGVEKSKSAAA